MNNVFLLFIINTDAPAVAIRQIINNKKPLKTECTLLGVRKSHYDALTM